MITHGSVIDRPPGRDPGTVAPGLTGRSLDDPAQPDHEPELVQTVEVTQPVPVAALEPHGEAGTGTQPVADTAAEADTRRRPQIARQTLAPQARRDVRRPTLRGREQGPDVGRPPPPPQAAPAAG